MEKIMLFKSRSQEQELLETSIKQHAADKSQLKILEAGCGRFWDIKLDGVQFTLTGVDIDKDALEIRKIEVNDLDEIVYGDLRTVDLKNDCYDVVYNSFVLEHIQNARQALDNFIMWLKPGGLLILKIPDRDSVYGFMTRVTPFWFHVLYKRYVELNKNAGKPGYPPYPTFLEEIVSRKGIHEYCKNNNCIIKKEYGAGFYFERKGVIMKFIRIFVKSVSLLSLGKLQWKHNNITYLIKKIR